MICALIGGILIGISTSLNLKLFRRITGMSGIFNSLIKYDHASGFMWKFFTFLGLVTLPVAAVFFDKGGITLGEMSITFFDSPMYLSG